MFVLDKTVSVPVDSLYESALQYFEEQGIDPRVKPSSKPSLELPTRPPEFFDFESRGMITKPCVINLIGVIFYAYCKVSVTNGRTFEGHAGGAGVGRLTAGGVIYYPDESKLYNTKDFGVFFVAKGGGTVHVTWGANGNATAAGIGSPALGAFGGRGNWK